MYPYPAQQYKKEKKKFTQFKGQKKPSLPFRSAYLMGGKCCTFISS
jgi:hypothetical protein